MGSMLTAAHGPRLWLSTQLCHLTTASSDSVLRPSPHVAVCVLLLVCITWRSPTHVWCCSPPPPPQPLLLIISFLLLFHRCRGIVLVVAAAAAAAVDAVDAGV